MKNIIVDIEDLSLHKEVYDSRPHKFFAIFIYGLLAMVAIAGIWSYFGKIDIVVRATGIMRPASQIATLINSVSGEIEEVNFYNGMQINQGDVLYVINTFVQQNELKLLEERQVQLEFSLQTMILYMESVKEGKDLIGDFNEEFSNRLNTFLINQNALNHANDMQADLLNNQRSSLNTHINNSNFEINILRTLENSIRDGENLFDNLTFTETLTPRNNELLNLHRTSFLSFALEMNNRDFQIQLLEKDIEGYLLIISSLDAGDNLFEEFNSHRTTLENHLVKYNRLNDILIEAVEAYNSLKNSEYGEYDYDQIASVEAQIDDLENEIRLLDASFRSSVNQSVQNLENQITSANTARDVFETNTLTGITSQITILESNLEGFSRDLTQNNKNSSSSFFVDDDLGEVYLNRLAEINFALNQIDLLEQDLLRIEIQKDLIVNRISEATVVAPISGIINTNIEIIEGNFLPTGLQTVSIIPVDEDEMIANIFISNSDITLIEEGQAIRYNIPGLTRRDVGNIISYIERISPDIVSDNQSLTGYFLVESDFNGISFANYNNQIPDVRIGTAFEARIIVAQQRIIFHLLDMLNLLIN